MLRSDFLFVPTKIYAEILNYVNIILLAPHNLFPFGASSDHTWEWKSQEIPSQRFLFAFSVAFELIPFSTSLYLHWNFLCGHLGTFSNCRPLGLPLIFAILVDSSLVTPPWFPPLRFTLIIYLWITTFPPVGGLLFFSFLGELHQSPNDIFPTVPRPNCQLRTYVKHKYCTTCLLINAT